MADACLHFLAKDGACPCGWTAPSAALLRKPEPVPLCEVCGRPGCEGTHVIPDEEPEDEGPDISKFEREFRALRAEKLKRSLYQFLIASWHVLEGETEFEDSKHIKAICDHVQWMLEDWMAAKKDKTHKQKAQNGAFSLPPGSLKTRIIMECAPAWMWTKCPSWTVRCLSVNPERARDSARNMRKIVESQWYQQTFLPDWQMMDDQDAVGDFGNTKGGVRKSGGIKAQIIGGRTDALFVDDPNAPDDNEDAFEIVNNKWDKTFYQRVNDLRISVRLIVQQRIDVLDLIGYVTKKDPDDWMCLVLPMLFVPERKCSTVYGWEDWRTTAGDCVHPERYTPAVVHKLKYVVLGPRVFESQCQQNPEAADGECFKMVWWNWWRPSNSKIKADWRRPEGCREDECLVVDVDRWGKLDVSKVIITVDATGGSENEGASHVGLLGCAVKDEKRLVVHDFAPGPRSWNDTVAELDLAIPVMAKMTGHMRIHVLIEKKALGKALSETIEKHVKEHGYEVDDQHIAVTVEDYEPPAGDKKTRGQAMEVPMALGEIYVPEGAPWLAPFFSEFKRFPKKPNDRVDSLAQFVDRFRKKMSWKDAFKATGR